MCLPAFTKVWTHWLTATAAVPPRELAEVIDQQPQSYDLNLTLGKLYRQRGENDKAINMHQALLDSPDTVNEKTRAGVVRTRAKLPKRRLG